MNAELHLEEALHAAGRVFGSGSVVAVRQQDHHPTLEQPLGFTCRPNSRISRVSLHLSGSNLTEADLLRWKYRRWSEPRWRNPRTAPPRWAAAWAGRCSCRTRTRAPPPPTADCCTPERIRLFSKAPTCPDWSPNCSQFILFLPPEIPSAGSWCGSEERRCRWYPDTPAWRVVGWTCLVRRPGRLFGYESLQHL